MPHLVPARTVELMSGYQYDVYVRVDKILSRLLLIEWVVAIIFAVVVTPNTWIGEQSSANIHVFVALGLGALLAVFPTVLVRMNAGATINRHVIVVAQSLMIGLFVHLTGGRIETHFGYFVSLAFFAYYRDWKVIVTATVVIAAEHLIRGLLYPYSVFGPLAEAGFWVNFWRTIEHAAWVIFEDIILIKACLDSAKELDVIAKARAETEAQHRITEVKNVELAATNQAIQQRVDEAVQESEEQRQDLSASVQQMLFSISEFSSGDLTVKAHGDSTNPHIQMLYKGFNQALAKVRTMMQEIAESIQTAASASTEISAATEQMSSGINEQAEQTSRIAGSIEHVSRVLEETNRQAGAAVQEAEAAKSDAVHGGNVVREAIRGINGVAEVVMRSAQTIEALGKSSEQIGEIVQVIEEIADQTNLLALNAAIEAARAGEQGRGFAVVADEVRKLAERTQKATKEIGTTIRQIQHDTNKAVESINQGTQEVNTGKQAAAQAVTALDGILSRTNKVATIVTELASAGQEQNTSVRAASEHADSISAIIGESAAATGEIARTAHDLSRLTERLDALMRNFQIYDQTNKREKNILNTSKYTPHLLQ
ncbi:MAG: methyl-accepting chemotaxis protein [Candidatus Kapaibacterium sp.]|nr:MAG: methyl-accepting chemotaxis protein [Candidatus Kapabacteria bacterium]